MCQDAYGLLQKSIIEMLFSQKEITLVCGFCLLHLPGWHSYDLEGFIMASWIISIIIPLKPKGHLPHGSVKSSPSVGAIRKVNWHTLCFSQPEHIVSLLACSWRMVSWTVRLFKNMGLALFSNEDDHFQTVGLTREGIGGGVVPLNSRGSCLSSSSW